MPQEQLTPPFRVRWNQVTWYSKLGAIIVFLGVIPALSFYIGTQYQLTVVQLEPAIHYNNVIVSPAAQRSPKNLFLGEILYQDINYDKYPDLGIQNESSGAYNIHYDFYMYNPATRTYELSALLPADLTSPTFDPKAQTVTSNDIEGGAGDFYTRNVYNWQDGTYVLTRRITGGGDVCTGLIRTTMELQDNKLVVTKTENLGADPDLCKSK